MQQKWCGKFHIRMSLRGDNVTSFTIRLVLGLHIEYQNVPATAGGLCPAEALHDLDPVFGWHVEAGTPNLPTRDRPFRATFDDDKVIRVDLHEFPSARAAPSVYATRPAPLTHSSTATTGARTPGT